MKTTASTFLLVSAMISFSLVANVSAVEPSKEVHRQRQVQSDHTLINFDSEDFQRTRSARSTAAFECLNINGIESRDEIGAPINEVITLDIGAGNVVTGFGAAFRLEAIAPSYIDEATILLSDTAAGDDPDSQHWSGGDSASGVMDVDLPPLIFSDQGWGNIDVLSDGILRIEFYEWYDDYPFSVDARYSNAFAPTTCNGLVFLCQDQVACDNAVALHNGQQPSTELIFHDSFQESSSQPTLPPLTPTWVDASDGTYVDRIRIQWASVLNSDYFEVFRCTSTSEASCGSALGQTSETIFDDFSASPGVTYRYRVRACNSAGCSALSIDDTGSRSSIASPPPVPAEPHASDGTYAGFVRVSWTGVVGGDYYELYRCTSITESSCGNAIYSGALNTYDDTGAAAGVTYYYRVKACSHSDGCSAFSPYNTGYAANSVQPPPVPSAPNASDDEFLDRIRLAWSPVSGADFYRVYRCTTQLVDSCGDPVATLSATLYDDLDASAGITYYYRLSSCLEGNVCSELSEPDSGRRRDDQPPPPTDPRMLNDTGIDWCLTRRDPDPGSQMEIGTCPAENSPQDGDVGRDSQARSGSLTKVGSGVAGFDFTKLSSDGSPLSSTASSSTCVRDNNTGLTWEIKPDSVFDLRHIGWTYTWFNPDAQTNGGESGTQDGGNCSGSSCDTTGYVSAVNAQGLCGRNDWRLPTVNELMSIAYFGDNFFSAVDPGGTPAVDRDYFPDLRSFVEDPNTALSDMYWASTPRATASGRAWSVFFRDYTTRLRTHSSESKTQARRVRLVAGNAAPSTTLCSLTAEPMVNNLAMTASTPTSDFEILGDGSTVLHKSTSLIWQRCSYGQTWNGSTCTGNPVALKWTDALNAGPVVLGTGWRLPNIKELASIVEHCKEAPAINDEVFPNTATNRGYWSSTPSASDEGNVLTIQFSLGETDWTRTFDLDENANLFRLVKDQ